ncbi:class III extradiol ring-cleavage dioxygenase [Thauera sp.]|uniref:dioxygenase family protein n=1 Tax=Thauera sp. TaxID=1905334 RepID=UPI002B5EFD12|nr:class III extradiol ring-cleavage dioxygenase [Thauera sp.]HRO36972.1 class III extradiol ring-cleavage dioxygenase [Thauera sp.]
MPTLPTLFVSHGAPTFALEPGRAGAGLAALGRSLPRPRAVLVVSPHWMTRQPQVTLSLRPETIHDFGGFGRALHELHYPAEGAHLAALRALELLQQAGRPATGDADRGLDHGAWVPLLHLYPEADVPVFQVSLPMGLDAEGAWQYGRALAPLADEGVLIVGSGSVTHNLYEVRFGDPQAEVYAGEFAAWVRAAVLAGDADRLRRTLEIAPHAHRAHPTTEHFLPLLVAAGAASQLEPATVIEGGVLHGVLSMDSFMFGTDLAIEAPARM